MIKGELITLCRVPVLGTLVLVTILALLAGCSPKGTGGGSTAGQEEAALARRLDEVERKNENTDLRLSRFIAMQDSVNQMRNQTGDQFPQQVFRGDGRFKTIASTEVFFNIDEYALDNEDQMLLDGMASKMAESPNSLLYIMGHADKSGSSEHNDVLSARRALSALRYLVKKYDIPLSRVSWLGVGTDDQKYPDDLGIARNKNRRIEARLVVFEPEQAAGGVGK